MSASKPISARENGSKTGMVSRRQIDAWRHKSGSLYLDTLDPLGLVFRRAFEALGEIIKPDYNPVHLKYTLDCLQRERKISIQHENSIDRFRELLHDLFEALHLSLWSMEKRRRMYSDTEEIPNEQIPIIVAKLVKMQDKLAAQYEKKFNVWYAKCEQFDKELYNVRHIIESTLIVLNAAGSSDSNETEHLDYLVKNLEYMRKLALRKLESVDDLHNFFYGFVDSLIFTMRSVNEEKRRKLAMEGEDMGMSEEECILQSE